MSHNCQLPSVLASLSLYCVITTTQPLQLYPADDSAHPHIIFRLRAAAVHAKISQLRCTSENVDMDPDDGRTAFLQRFSIACYAERCISCSKSVRLSVRLSVTRWH